MVNHLQKQILLGLKLSVGIQPFHVLKSSNPDDRLLKVELHSYTQCYRMTWLL